MDEMASRLSRDGRGRGVGLSFAMELPILVFNSRPKQMAPRRTAMRQHGCLGCLVTGETRPRKGKTPPCTDSTCNLSLTRWRL